jgi:hypothetical protein
MALTLNGDGTISSLPNHEDLTVSAGGVINSSSISGVINPASIPYIGRRNLIINGAMQVAQRGTSFTSNGYTVDRWKTYNSGGAATLTQQIFNSGESPEVGIVHYIRIVRSSPVGTYFFSQKIEDVRKSDSATLTMSFYGKASSNTTVGCRITQEFGSGGSSGVNITAQNAEFTSTWQKFSLTFNMASLSGKTIGTGSNFEPVFDIPATTATIEITGVQVEYGDIATPFEHRGHGEELLSCQRYYEIGVIFGQYKSSDDTGGWAHYKVTKRVNPSISIYPPDNSQANYAYYYSTAAADRGNRLVNEINPTVWFAGQTDYTSGVYAIMGGFTPTSVNDATWVGNYRADAEL